MIRLYTAQKTDRLQSRHKEIESMNIQLYRMNDQPLSANSSVQIMKDDQIDV